MANYFDQFDRDTNNQQAGNIPASVSQPTTANNMGNIRDNQSGGFRSYHSAEEGIADQQELLSSYQTKHGLNTTRQIAYRWAPPTENDTESYLNGIASIAGFDPDEPLDLSNSDTLGRLSYAQAVMEKGRKNVPDQSVFMNVAGAGNNGTQGGANYFDQFDSEPVSTPTRSPVSPSTQTPSRTEPEASQQPINRSWWDKTKDAGNAVADFAQEGLDFINPVHQAEHIYDYITNPTDTFKSDVRSSLYTGAKLADIPISLTNFAIKSGAAISGHTTPVELPPAESFIPDQYQPRNYHERFAGDVAPWFIPFGKTVKAAEGAGIAAKAGYVALRDLQASVTGTASSNPTAPPSEFLKELGTNAAIGLGIGLTAKAAGAGVSAAKDAYKSLDKYERMADIANPQYVQHVSLGTPEEQQFTQNTLRDRGGDLIITPDIAYNTEAGAKYIRQQQRDIANGGSQWGERLESQNHGEGIKHATYDLESDLSPLSTHQASENLSNAVRDEAKYKYDSTMDAAKELYYHSGATQVEIPNARAIAKYHIDEDIYRNGKNLSPKSRELLEQLNSDTIKDLDDLDWYKQELKQQADKDYVNKDYKSSKKLIEVRNSLRNDADVFLQDLDPNLKSLYDEGDKYYSQIYGDFNPKSKRGVFNRMSKITDPVKQAEFFSNGTDTSNVNMRGAYDTFHRMQYNGLTPNIDQMTADFAQAHANEIRKNALKYSTDASGNFDPKKYVSFMNRTDEGAMFADQAYANATGIPENVIAPHDSLRGTAELYKNRGKVSAISRPERYIKHAAALTAGKIGFSMGGHYGAGIGIGVGEYAVGKMFNSGFIDNLLGVGKRGEEGIEFLSNPDNAKRVLDILKKRKIKDVKNPDATEVLDIINILKKTAQVEHNDKK